MYSRSHDQNRFLKMKSVFIFNNKPDIVYIQCDSQFKLHVTKCAVQDGLLQVTPAYPNFVF